MQSGGKTLFKKKRTSKQVSHALVSQKIKTKKKMRERRKEGKNSKTNNKNKNTGANKFPNIRSVFIYSACLYVAGTF